MNEWMLSDPDQVLSLSSLPFHGTCYESEPADEESSDSSGEQMSLTSLQASEDEEAVQDQPGVLGFPPVGDNKIAQEYATDSRRLHNLIKVHEFCPIGYCTDQVCGRLCMEVSMQLTRNLQNNHASAQLLYCTTC